MASNNPTNMAYRHYFNRRRGIITALTTGVDEILGKCKTVLPGADYKFRYILTGSQDGGYTVKHPDCSFVHGLEPPCLPLFCGHMTEKIWLMLATETSNAWLLSTIMADTTFMAEDQKKHLLERIERLPEIKSDVLLYHRRHPRVGPVTPTDLSMVEELSPCENGSCFFVGNRCWIECVICCQWFHRVCVGVSPADIHCRYCFICESC